MACRPLQRPSGYANHQESWPRPYSGLDQITVALRVLDVAAAGGHVLPHTDAPAKIVTLIVSMVREGEWDHAFGGGTDVNRPKSNLLSFNQLNRNARFEDMDVLYTFEFTPNQGVIFIKTFNSWHSVRPMTGMNSTAMRKTLTINIEEVS